MIRADEPPVRKTARRRRSLSDFIPYLKKRWSEGERNAARLWCELKEQGFLGSDSLVRHFLQDWREAVPEEAKRKFFRNRSGISRLPPSPRQTG